MRPSFARLTSLLALAVATATFAGAAAANGGGDNGGNGGGDNGSSGQYQKSDSSSTSQGGGDEQKSSDSSKSYSVDVKKSSGNGGDQSSNDSSKSYSKSYKSDVKKSSDNGGDQSSNDNSKSYSKSYKSEVKSSDVKGVQKSLVEADHKITLCHLTGNGTYVSINVDKHSLKNGHTAEKGDIIPIPAGGCPAGVQVVQAKTDCSAPSVAVKVTKSESQGTNQQGQFEGEHQDDNGSKSSSIIGSLDHGVNCAQPSGDTKAAVVQQAPTCAAPLVAVKVEDDHSDQHGQFEGQHSDGDHSTSTTYVVSNIKCVQPENLAPAVLVQQKPSCTAPLVAVTVTTETNQQGQFEGQHSDSSSTAIVYKAGDVTCVAPASLVTPTVNSTASVAAAGVTPASSPASVTATPSTQAPTASAAGALPAAQGQPVAAAQPQGGVAGAQATLNQPKPNRGGVLGAVGNIAGASLPFTGFPLWIAVLLAVALVAGGLMLSRRGRGDARL
jgi:hypothetical protein